MGDKTLNDMEILLTSIGDEPITLMDQYERLSFEVQLNQAILGRSLSESCVPRTWAGPGSKTKPKPEPKPVSLHLEQMVSQAHQGPKKKKAHGFGFRKVLGKLLKPIFFRGNRKNEVSDAKDLKTWKAFSKSMRV